MPPRASVHMGQRPCPKLISTVGHRILLPKFHTKNEKYLLCFSYGSVIKIVLQRKHNLAYFYPNLFKVSQYSNWSLDPTTLCKPCKYSCKLCTSQYTFQTINSTALFGNLQESFQSFSFFLFRFAVEQRMQTFGRYTKLHPEK